MKLFSAWLPTLPFGFAFGTMRLGLGLFFWNGIVTCFQVIFYVHFSKISFVHLSCLHVPRRLLNMQVLVRRRYIEGFEFHFHKNKKTIGCRPSLVMVWHVLGIILIRSHRIEFIKYVMRISRGLSWKDCICRGEAQSHSREQAKREEHADGQIWRCSQERERCRLGLGIELSSKFIITSNAVSGRRHTTWISSTTHPCFTISVT